MYYASFAFALFLLFSVLVMPAQSEISCHCFQDRSFNAAKPAAADLYFLVTSQNSLLAAALDIPKRSIVQAKMAGADADLLLVSYYVSNRTGLEVEALVEMLTSSGSAGLLGKLGNMTYKFDQPFITALGAGIDLEQLARGAYHSIMITQLGIDVMTLERLEFAGADRQEQILAIFISFLLAEDAVDIYASIKAGRQTWGQSFDSTGLAADQIEASWQKLISLHQAGRS